MVWLTQVSLKWAVIIIIPYGFDGRIYSFPNVQNWPKGRTTQSVAPSCSCLWSTLRMIFISSTWHAVNRNHLPPSSTIKWVEPMKKKSMNEQENKRTNKFITSQYRTVLLHLTLYIAFHGCATLPHINVLKVSQHTLPAFEKVARRCASVIEGGKPWPCRVGFWGAKSFSGFKANMATTCLFWGGANPWFPWYLEMVCRKFPKMEVLWTFPFHFTIRFTSELGISHWASHSISQTCSGNKIDKPTEKSSWLFPFKLP